MKVKSGVPIPPMTGGRPRTERGRAVHALKIGQCIECENDDEFDSVRRMIYALGGKAVSRRKDLRVWRVA